jgi:phage terminase large subunit-like protein
MWLSDRAMEAAAIHGGGGRLALIGPTLHDVREVMIEGVSGIRSLSRWTRADRPRFEPSRRRLVFDNGAVAQAFSAEDPDSLRGPQFSAAWADEFCAWPARGARGAGETLALLRMGLRLGERPRLVITTTPRPTRALIALRDEASCVVTRAATAENAAHLSPGFLEELTARYGGTRRAAQELEGQVVEIDGALFTAAMMAAARAEEDLRPWGTLGARTGAGEGSAPAGFERVVVGVDPTTTAGGDACGIVVVGRRRIDGVARAVVLADRSERGLSPDGWARRAKAAALAWGAGSIVAEVNQGGEMVRAVFRAVGCETPVIEVRAATGKRARAEPVAALYERGRVTHAGAFDALEEELMAIGSDGDGGLSLDRADALVWAVSALMLNGAGEGPRIRRL